MVALLSAQLAIPVVTQDERLSSHEAEERLSVREKDWRKRKAKLDAAAAAVILQDYLDAQPRSGRGVRGEGRGERGDRRVKRAVFVLFALAAVAGVVVVAMLYKRTSEPFKGYGGAEQFVAIEPGSGTRTIGERLIQAGVVRDDTTFRAALWRTGRARSLQAGEFRFDRPMTPAEVIEKIARGDVYNRRITFPEGLTIQEMARIFEQQGFGKAAAFVEAARDASAIREHRSVGARPRRLSLSRNLLCCRARLPRRRLVSVDGRTLHAAVHTRDAAGGAGARADDRGRL